MKNNIAYKKGGILYFNNSVLPSKRIVMKRMGVKRRTFAGNVVSRLYDFYFQGALDFNKDFRKYYKKEYASIVDYMEQHHNISHDNALFMSKGSFSMKNCVRDSVERNIENINYDKELKNAFSNAIGVLIDEDTYGIYYE